MTFRRFFLSLFAILLPGAVIAHPHVYIDAGLELVYDGQGNLSGVNVEWAYDEFYSLLIIEDHALDQDGDSILTPEENQLIQGFDADWVPDSAGGLYLYANGQHVGLGMPRNFRAEYRDGRLISRHFRPLLQPFPGDEAFTIQIYDPEFYVDFSVPEAPVTKGRECMVKLLQGDDNASANAYLRAVEEALGSGADIAEADIITVNIGAAGADEIHVNCGEAAQ